ncbi:TPA: DUF551 domain-containing protein [Klebsiella pneumoniae subsp. pneumoniae]|nr:DUF551 domain-containing protein [Klebsiella pneumoniae subsp. pneumoniae]
MTSKLTRERIELIANFHRAMALPPSHAEIEELASMALAAMDSEPVAWLLSGGGTKNVVCFDSGNAYADPLREVTPLYRHAQPALVIPDEMTAEQAYEIGYYYGDPVNVFARGANWMRQHIIDSTLAAAQHDTPALNSVQSVDSVADRWIPVSEQMPPSRHEVLVGRWWGEKPRWCCKWATYIPGHPDAQSSGWLIPGASWTPTHWMPLPAAPQEVKSES